MNNHDTPVIFIPNFFLLWDLILVIILVIGIDLWLCLNLKDKINFWEFSIFLIILKVVIIYAFWILLCYPTMNYALYKDRLVLKCGLSKSVIFYKDIKNISLVPSLGFFSLLGKHRPWNFIEGIFYSLKLKSWIRMYATSHKNVIIIETDKKRYGITPQEPERFLAELKGYIERKDNISTLFRCENVLEKGVVV